MLVYRGRDCAIVFSCAFMFLGQGTLNKSIYHAMPAMLCWEKKVLGYKGNRSVRDAPTCSYNLLEGTGQSQSGESNPTSGWELFAHWDQCGPKKCACVVGANPFDIDLVIFVALIRICLGWWSGIHYIWRESLNTYDTWCRHSVETHQV